MYNSLQKIFVAWQLNSYVYNIHCILYFCISHCTNTFGKGMNPIILPPAMGK